MSISGKRYAFTKKNVDKSPNEHGVFALFDASELIYVGRAAGNGMTIRSEMQKHLGTEDAVGAGKATHYCREATEDSEQRLNELLTEYKQANEGRLPRRNEGCS